MTKAASNSHAPMARFMFHTRSMSKDYRWVIGGERREIQQWLQPMLLKQITPGDAVDRGEIWAAFRHAGHCVLVTARLSGRSDRDGRPIRERCAFVWDESPAISGSALLDLRSELTQLRDLYSDRLDGLDAVNEVDPVEWTASHSGAVSRNDWGAQDVTTSDWEVVRALVWRVRGGEPDATHGTNLVARSGVDFDQLLLIWASLPPEHSIGLLVGGSAFTPPVHGAPWIVKNLDQWTEDAWGTADTRSGTLGSAGIPAEALGLDPGEFSTGSNAAGGEAPMRVLDRLTELLAEKFGHYRGGRGVVGRLVQRVFSMEEPTQYPLVSSRIRSLISVAQDQLDVEATMAWMGLMAEIDAWGVGASDDMRREYVRRLEVLLELTKRGLQSGSTASSRWLSELKQVTADLSCILKG